ncbi:magnesium transporter [Candidatus Marinimicrobia bacterium]|nr:magnesium transporter [Candidatus Neomarinimicrobiota bacterium]
MVGFDNKRILDTIRRLYRRNSKVTLYKVINKMHPSQMVSVYRYLNPKERINIFSYILRMEGVGEFIKELDETLTKEIFSALKNNEMATILQKMQSEDIAELIEDLEPKISARIQELLNKKEQLEVEEVLQYEDESAGRIMSHEFMAFDSELSIEDARKRFREYGDEIEMPFYIYVVDRQSNKMIGVVSLRQLLLNTEEKILKDIMETDFIFVSPDDDQEKVANIVSEYNYLALPVLNKQSELIGIITVDDVMDVIREEATEDMLKMAGAGDDEDILLKPIIENAKTRFPWLMPSWIGGLCAMAIISYFESFMQEQLILAAFIPIIIGMGGNIGTQTSTMIVRGISTGHVNMMAFYKVIFKEIKVGAILGLIYGGLLGLMGATLANLSHADIIPIAINAIPVQFGLTVGLSIFFSMLIGCAVASFIPIMLYKLKLDPAIATGPFVTTAIDILGVIAYFLIASIIL